MANDLRVAVEVGPKGKKVATYAPDWPGLARGAKTPELAIERLTSYIPRYAPVAKLAGMSEAFASVGEPSVVETYPGTGSTDFWGISFAFSAFDQQPVSNAELERELALMQACWAYFDEVRYRVSDELRKGPRGGGRDRENVVRHVIGNEYDWGKGIGVEPLPEGEWRDDAKLRAYHEAYAAAIRNHHTEGKMAKKWPLRYLIRHTAFHTLDHTWEMEGRDLNEPPS
jgi:hypothetical protein